MTDLKAHAKPLGQTVGLRLKDTQHAWDARTDASRFARWHDEKGDHAYADDRTTRANAADDLLTTVAEPMPLIIPDATSGGTFGGTETTR